MPLSLPTGLDYYYTPEFKTIIRSCKEILLNQAIFSPFVGEDIKFAYRYNFHKLLRQLGGENPSVPEDMIWVISFVNGIEDPNKDFSHLKGIWSVTKEQVDSVIQVNRVRRE